MNLGTEKPKKDMQGVLQVVGEILNLLSTKDRLDLREDALLLSYASLSTDKTHESEDAGSVVDATAVLTSHFGTMRELKRKYREFNIQEI